MELSQEQTLCVENMVSALASRGVPLSEEQCDALSSHSYLESGTTLSQSLGEQLEKETEDGMVQYHTIHDSCC